ncbi:MAG: bifunctional nuclease family protein [Tannerella sp.]|nr:bifunctional nuclease family protein [Tannerella sp.]
MNREFQMYGYELTAHEITGARLIKLHDEQGEILLIVPMEMFAVSTFFRCLIKQEKMSIPAHKMFLDVMKALGGKMQKVVIDDLQNGRFFASIHFTGREGETNTVKAEASDALAMAFRAPCYVYIKESVIDAAKNDRSNRVYWYNPKDEESLRTVRSYSHDKLVSLPFDDVEQLIEIAAEIEDFEFAARLKKARDAQLARMEEIREILNTHPIDPVKFAEKIEEEINKKLRNFSDNETNTQ